MEIEAIPLPSFTLALWASAAGGFLVCGLLLFLWRSPGGASRAAAFLTPFLIPVSVTSFTILAISSIGSLLLTVGKTLAVPIAMALAVAVLLIASVLAARSGEAPN